MPETNEGGGQAGIPQLRMTEALALLEPQRGWRVREKKSLYIDAKCEKIMSGSSKKCRRWNGANKNTHHNLQKNIGAGAQARKHWTCQNTLE